MGKRSLLFIAYILYLWGMCGNCSEFPTLSSKTAYQYEVEKWLKEVDTNWSEFNTISAHLTWKSMTNPDQVTMRQSAVVAPARNAWRNRVCASELKKEWLTAEQSRKIYLLCRGPHYSDELYKAAKAALGQLSAQYNAKICFPENEEFLSDSKQLSLENFPRPGSCVHGEPDIEILMKRTDLTEEQLRFLWLSWYDSVGSRTKEIFHNSVIYENAAAFRNGYQNIGEAWREELEIPNLERVVINLYDEIKPIYVMLHAVIRHKLHQKYGSDIINPKGPIPVHLLGNIWAQDWTPLIKLFSSEITTIDLDERLFIKNITVKDMVLEAEDFYTSIGMGRMNANFWKNSILEENDNLTECHGTSANLYNGDYRMLMCGMKTIETLYAIHHEMGHAEYYIAYQEQPSFFQEGTNSAFHESIGDTIWHGVMTPQHLQRLRLLHDDEVADTEVEFFLILYQALAKIPEIPFSLIIDLYRWRVFDGTIPFEDLNKAYWQLTLEYRGMIPPNERSEEFFDAAGKFHVPDYTPYIRYFLSSIIQVDLFKSMCKTALFGDNVEENRDNEKVLPLHRCDIYGSKKSGKLMMNMMRKGASIKWYEALKMLTGRDTISTKPFLQYYEPVGRWLEKYISKHNIYVGW